VLNKIAEVHFETNSELPCQFYILGSDSGRILLEQDRKGSVTNLILFHEVRVLPLEQFVALVLLPDRDTQLLVAHQHFLQRRGSLRSVIPKTAQMIYQVR
jgi:hypothetical protein